MIERLELKNFKAIKEGIFDLENLTLFSGLNGMGKSSALQSLLLLRQSHEKHLLPNTGISLTGDYVSIGTGKDLLFMNADEDIIEINIFETDSELSLQFEYQERSDLQPIMDSKIIEGTPFDSPLFTSAFQYLSAERISPKSIYEASEYAVNNKRFLGKTGEYTAHFLAEHGDEKISIDELMHEGSSTNNLIGNVNAWMSEITPGTKVIAKLIPEINQASLHYQFESASELTDRFRPENTGFGLTYVLPVVTAVLSAKPGDLLIIENPESHLHPSGQSTLARLIAIASQSGVQIIIETHSDHFLNGIRTSVKDNFITPDNVSIYFLSRNLNNKEHCANIDPVYIDEMGRIDHWPDGFFDEWDKSLDALIRGA